MAGSAQVFATVKADWSRELSDTIHRSNDRDPYILTAEAAEALGLSVAFVWKIQSIEVVIGDVIHVSAFGARAEPVSERIARCE